MEDAARPALVFRVTAAATTPCPLFGDTLRWIDNPTVGPMSNEKYMLIEKDTL